MSLLSSAVESQPGNPYFYNLNVSGGGGGGGGGVEAVSANGGADRVGNINFVNGNGLALANVGQNFTYTNTGVLGVNAGGFSNLTGGLSGLTFVAGNNMTITATGGATPTITFASDVSGSDDGIFNTITANTATLTDITSSGTTTLNGVTMTGLTVGEASVGTLAVVNSAAVVGSLIVGQRLTGQSQTLSVNASNSIVFNGITIPDGTYICTIRGSDSISYFSAAVGLWGDVATGAGEGITKLAISSNVNAVSPNPLSFNSVDDGDGLWNFTPIFTSTLVNTVSSFTCTMSPSFQ